MSEEERKEDQQKNEASNLTTKDIFRVAVSIIVIIICIPIIILYLLLYGIWYLIYSNWIVLRVRIQ